MVPGITHVEEAHFTRFGVRPLVLAEAVDGSGIDPLFTVNESMGWYMPIGRFDGIGAYSTSSSIVCLLGNHEASAATGASSQLVNGLELTGARIDFFDVSKESSGVVAARIAYDTIYDRTGTEVMSAAQINEAGVSDAGLDRFCSAQHVALGTGATIVGSFVPIGVASDGMAGASGYDDAGYKDEDTLNEEALDGLGAFQFARPEDVATNPGNGAQAVFAAPGSNDGPDLWGGLYVVDFENMSVPTPAAVVEILLDGNDTGDESVRNPNNLDWADDGFIYVQEDRANSEFGKESGRDASVYRVRPVNGGVETISVFVEGGHLVWISVRG